jgi:hypothetical protein
MNLLMEGSEDGPEGVGEQIVITQEENEAINRVSCINLAC